MESPVMPTIFGELHEARIVETASFEVLVSPLHSGQLPEL
jgi:hypothetical protein